MRQCQHTGRPPHGAIGLWFARPACQHTHTPTHQAITAPPSHREPVSLPHPGVRRMPTAHPLHTRRRCPLRWLSHRRPAHRTPTQGHRQTPQTNASHKHRSPVLAHGLGCRMRARHLHRASGLPHRRAHAHGPMAAPAPRHPGPVPCGRSPLPYTALYSPLSPFIVLDGTCAPQRAVGVYTFGLSMGSPGNSTGGASSGGSIGSGFGSWSLLGSLGVVAMGCTSCRRYSATSVVLASAWASKRKG